MVNLEGWGRGGGGGGGGGYMLNAIPESPKIKALKRNTCANIVHVTRRKNITSQMNMYKLNWI